MNFSSGYIQSTHEEQPKLTFDLRCPNLKSFSTNQENLHFNHFSDISASSAAKQNEKLKNAAIFQKSNLHFYTFVGACNLRGKLLPNKYFYKKQNVEMVKETNGLLTLLLHCRKIQLQYQTQSHFAIFLHVVRYSSQELQRANPDQCAGHARFHEEIQFCALFPFLIVTTTDERSCSYPGKQQPSSS